MKIILIALVLISFGNPAQARGTRVSGYTKRSGTYVPSHRRTNPDSTKSNNWSTKGNVNPDTGKTGTK